MTHASRSLVRNISRVKSESDDSEYFYGTPSTSPEREMFNDEDDNKILDAYLDETYEDLKKICEIKESEWKNVILNF